MDKETYLHAIYALSDYYDSKATLKVLKKILASDAILSARLQDKNYHKVLFNGWDYISLFDYEKRGLVPTSYNTYDAYIQYSLSMMFPKSKLEVIKPIIVEKITDYDTMYKYGMSKGKRYTDLPDEVQVKDKIPLKLMTGITLPISKMKNIFFNEARTINMVLREIDKVNNLLTEYNREVPLYDIDSEEKLDNSEDIKHLVRQYYKK